MVNAPAERAPTAGRRFAALVVAALVGFLAGPGVLFGDGSVLLAALWVGLWARTAMRPLGERPGRARLAEWLAGGLQGGLVMWWASYIVGAGWLAIVLGWGLHPFLAGVLLRRLRTRLPLALAVAVAWTAEEALRAALDPPFGLGWLRLGHHVSGHLWLAGSARVVGVEGLTLVLAALGGALLALAHERRLRPATAVTGLVPLALAALVARAVPAPVTVDGPRVLLVQPGFEQARKMYGDPLENFRDSTRLTLDALQTLRAQQDGADLVVWGESMLSVPLFSEDSEAALAAGVRAPPWQPVDGGTVAACAKLEDQWVRRGLLDLLPPGVSFAAGAEYWSPRDGALRRQVAVVLYDETGRRHPAAKKRHLVPLGETLYGFERLAVARDLAFAVAGYVPDFLAADETTLLELQTRSGARSRMGGSVCFDNAFAGPYVADVRAGAEWHLVSSNEAWYRTSCELDQMVAFSRLVALSTARSVVRATNSGVSLVLAPDGRELGRVRDESGRDRATSGWGAWTIPVPAGPGATPFVRFFPWIRAAAMALGLLALLPRRSRG